MDATSRDLEITVLSCEDLRINGKPVKKNTYVVVRTDPLNYRETTMDIKGGSYPSWGQKLVLNISMHERFVTLEVHIHGKAHKLIGSARMPVTDFMGGYLPDNYLNFLSYRLRDEKGLRNGIINVSVRVKTPEHFSTNQNEKVVAEKKFSTTTSLPALSVPMGEKNFGGIVTGIPIWGGKGSGYN